MLAKFLSIKSLELANRDVSEYSTVAMFDGLWNVSIDCLVFKVLVACFYCLPTVNIPCGMCLLLVECIDDLWNMSIAR